MSKRINGVHANFTHHPCCDHYHCLLRNIHHHAECACLGCALGGQQFIKLRSVSWKKINRFQVLNILVHTSVSANNSSNLTHDPRVHQGSAHLHQNREYKSQVEPAIGNTMIQVKLYGILVLVDISVWACSVLQLLHGWPSYVNHYQKSHQSLAFSNITSMGRMHPWVVINGIRINLIPSCGIKETACHVTQIWVMTRILEIWL